MEKWLNRSGEKVPREQFRGTKLRKTQRFDRSVKIPFEAIFGGIFEIGVGKEKKLVEKGLDLWSNSWQPKLLIPYDAVAYPWDAQSS